MYEPVRYHFRFLVPGQGYGQILLPRLQLIHTGLGLVGVYLSGKLTLYFLYLFPDLGYLVFHGRQVIGCHHRSG